MWTDKKQEERRRKEDRHRCKDEKQRLEEMQKLLQATGLSEEGGEIRRRYPSTVSYKRTKTSRPMYLTGFEEYMESLDVRRDKWPRQLVLTLTPEARWVQVGVDSESKKSYSDIKVATTVRRTGNVSRNSGRNQKIPG